MYALDKITLGDQANPLYKSYEYTPKASILGLPAWAALLIFIALPILAFLSFYLRYGNQNA